MADEKKEAAPKIRVVYLGKAKMEGGKKGLLFISSDWLLAHPEADWKAIWQQASIFDAKGKRPSLIVGAIYASTGELGENGSVQRLGVNALATAGRSDHPVLAEFELRAEADKAEEDQARLARKLKEEPRLDGEIRALAQLLRSVPYTQQAAAETAIIQAIRNASRRL